MIKGLVASYILYPIAERMEKRDIRGKLKEIKTYYTKPFLFREALLKKNLYDQVLLASQKVPYYRDLFAKIQFDPEKLKKDVRFINEIPFLDKNIIAEQGTRLINEALAANRSFPCKTGGSTGKSVVIHYDQDGADWSAATTLYARALCGNKRHKRELHLSSELPDIRTGRDKFREDMKCLSMNRTNVFYKLFDDESLRRILSEMGKAKTHLVHGHPSTMYRLALAAEQSGQKIRFDIFESSGEYLPAKKAELIEKVFHCRAINRYGLAEAGVIAYQTGSDTEHLQLFDHLVYPETVLDEVVITPLKNHYMPLIRYKTGDLGNVVRTDHGLELAQLRGRVHDSVVIDNKVYLTHYIQDMLDRFGGVSDFQILAKENEKPILRIVLEENADPKKLEENIFSIWKDKLAIQYISQQELRLVGRRHKFRYVIDSV